VPVGYVRRCVRDACRQYMAHNTVLDELWAYFAVMYLDH
jgi:hypothetical protein